MTSQSLKNKALKVFKKAGGILHTSEAIAQGIHPETLYSMRDSEEIEQLQRGLYALPNLPNLDYPDYAIVSKLFPDGVICLTAALCFHHLTVQMPKWIDVALPRSKKQKHIAYPPTEFHWFSDKVHQHGIEIHKVGKYDIKIYSIEKTVVDCFRLRNKVGPEVAIEGLKRYLKDKPWDFPTLLQFAKESRVEKIMRPYIEAIIDEQS